MLIEISTKDIYINEETRETIFKKFRPLYKLLTRASQVAPRLHLRFVRTTGEHHKKGNIFAVDARLYIAHTVIKAANVGDNLFTISDDAKEELERQLLKKREKQKASTRRTRRKIRTLRGKT